MSEALPKAIGPDIEKIIAKVTTADESVSTLPLTKITVAEEVKEAVQLTKISEVKHTEEVLKVAEVKEVKEVNKVEEVAESSTEQPAAIPTPNPNPIDLKQLGLTASDDSGLADVIDDFDNALSLKANEQPGNNSFNELQQIQSVQSHLSAGSKKITLMI